jgi:transcriptional regulator with XRE-family HTH domain
MSLNKITNTIYLVKFGNHLRGLRKSKKMTLKQLAAAAAVDISQVHKIEKGKINTTLSTLIALSKALETSMGELLNTDFNTLK